MSDVLAMRVEEGAGVGEEEGAVAGMCDRYYQTLRRGCVSESLPISLLVALAARADQVADDHRNNRENPSSATVWNPSFPNKLSDRLKLST